MNRCVWSIPAQAGEPYRMPVIATRSRVYPRAGGGTRFGSVILTFLMGLSPRRRGNPRLPAAPHHQPRVYPRAGGGTRTVPFFAVSIQGLSPRRRGNHIGSPERHRQFGSIPAQAGEPRGPGRSGARRWVYPRAGGGTQSAPRPHCQIQGLSPRRRGNRSARYWRLCRAGSIPAQAGEPTQCGIGCARKWVYPRAGGGTSIN